MDGGRLLDMTFPPRLDKLAKDHASGENLTNKQYEFLKNYPAPGIAVMAWANLSVGKGRSS